MEVIYGVDCVANALKSRIRPAIHRLIVYGDEHEELVKLAPGIRLHRASRLELDRLVGAGRPHQDVALQVTPFSIPTVNLASAAGRWLALDGIIDPQNLGSITRSAAFFSIDGIIIPKANAVGLNPTVSKTSAGALELIGNRFWHPPAGGLAPLLLQAKAKGWSVIGTAPCWSEIANGSSSGNQILVLGNEGKGIKDVVREACTHWWSIEGKSGTGIDSLNVGVAAGILMQRLTQQ